MSGTSFHVSKAGPEGPRRTPTSWFAAVVADPCISRGADGRLTLNWDPDAPDHCVVHRSALVDLIGEVGRLHDELEQLRALAPTEMPYGSFDPAIVAEIADSMIPGDRRSKRRRHR